MWSSKDGSDKVSHQRACCGLKPPGVMDCRTALILLLTAHATCSHPIDITGPVNEAIQQMRSEAQTALGKLNIPGLLPNINCLSLNISEIVGREEDHLTAHSFSSFRCFMIEMSKETPDLRQELEKAGQLAQDIQLLISSVEDPLSCSKLSFEDEIKAHVCVRHFLQHLDQRLSKGTLNLTA